MDDKNILKWFQFADNDLDTAEILLLNRPQHYEIICYHCQQAVEKYLKGYLLFQGVEFPPKIHNLITLCELCSNYNDRFDSIQNECGILTIYGVQPRYPDEIYLTEELMKQAISYARQIKNFGPLTAVWKELEKQDKT